MVFHDINSITNVISDHRVIVYYVEGKVRSSNETKLCNILETSLEMLLKKNDDLLIFKILLDSVQFQQMHDVYKPEITGVITLFVVNKEGIPLASIPFNEELKVFDGLEHLCSVCNLNCILKTEMTKISLQIPKQMIQPENILPGSTVALNENNRDTLKTIHSECDILTSPTNAMAHNLRSTNDSSNSSVQKNDLLTSNLLSAELSICLPSGVRKRHSFNKTDLLKDVWLEISKKYDIKDFHLRTYNCSMFKEEEYIKTLEELDLCPNGVLIVVEKIIKPYNFGQFGGIIYYITHNIVGKTVPLFQYIQGLLFTFWNYIFPSDNNGERQSRNQLKPGNTRELSGSVKGKDKYVSKRFSNVHTLRRDDNSDDENNRYNGNSTQQK